MFYSTFFACSLRLLLLDLIDLACIVRYEINEIDVNTHFIFFQPNNTPILEQLDIIR